MNTMRSMERGNGCKSTESSGKEADKIQFTNCEQKQMQTQVKVKVTNCEQKQMQTQVKVHKTKKIIGEIQILGSSEMQIDNLDLT